VITPAPFSRCQGGLPQALPESAGLLGVVRPGPVFRTGRVSCYLFLSRLEREVDLIASTRLAADVPTSFAGARLWPVQMTLQLLYFLTDMHFGVSTYDRVLRRHTSAP
jgi:hypothetical protein